MGDKENSFCLRQVLASTLDTVGIGIVFRSLKSAQAP